MREEDIIHETQINSINKDYAYLFNDPRPPIPRCDAHHVVLINCASLQEGDVESWTLKLSHKFQSLTEKLPTSPWSLHREGRQMHLRFELTAILHPRAEP